MATQNGPGKRAIEWASLKKAIIKQRYLFLMSVPFMIWILVFRYAPMYGWLYSFQNFTPSKGVWRSEWVGLAQYVRFFKTPEAMQAVRNTIVLSSINLILGNLMPVGFALLINEIRTEGFKRTVQTISYLPHFVSFVVVANLFMAMMSMKGPLNAALVGLGILEEPMLFWAKGKLFWVLVPIINTWKGMGWGAIIYLAAIAGVNTELYDSATIDGCGRFQKVLHVTLPGILPTIVVLWVLSLSHLFSGGFEQSFLLGNAANRAYSDVIDTLTYRYGIGMSQYSFSTAIGLVQVLMGFLMVAISNRIAKTLTEYSLW